MSLEARGALAFVLSHPSDWTFSQEWLAKECRIGRQKAQGIVREWIEQRFCWRRQGRQSTGRHGAVEYLFSDEPKGEFEPADEDTPAPRVENRTAVVSPRVEKPLSGPTAGGETDTTKETKKQKTQITKIPPTPQTRRGRVRGARGRDAVNRMLEELRSVGCAEHVVEHFFDPVLRQLSFESPDPITTLAEIAAKAQGYQEEPLARAASYLKRTRVTKVTAQAMEKALAALGTPGASMASSITVTSRNHPQQFAAWLAFHQGLRRAGRPNFAMCMEKHGFLLAPSLWPPGRDDRPC
jgi:hypothetical protein